jgi:hypothetical protein
LKSRIVFLPELSTSISSGDALLSQKESHLSRRERASELGERSELREEG